MRKKRAVQKNKEPGYITSFFAGIGKVKGLKNVFLHELLLDKNGKPAAMVTGFDEQVSEALFFNEEFDFTEPVFRSSETFSIPVSEDIVGRIVDGLGNPLDSLGKVNGEKLSVFNNAPSIIDREPVSQNLSTGIKVIDVTLPLGRGQRELIIGDRKLGKSTIATDIVLNQKHASPKVYCIYVLCSQKEQKLKELISIFEEHNAFLYTTVVAALTGTPFAGQYLAPFIGCTIGEFLRNRGKDVLIVYDDLSKHAKIYRDINLLLERVPGRESYPTYVFSLHATLLERAAKLSKEKGGGSLTAIPIIETQEGDIASFIPTNLISITDGQIYLERGLFQKGFLPAVNVGLSVSRVGSKAQPEPLRKVTGGIRLALAQHRELQKLSQLETTASKETQSKIFRGELTLELLKQKKHTTILWPEQTILFYVVEQGFFDDIKKEKWGIFEGLLLELIRNRYPKVLEEIGKGAFNEKVKNEILEIVNDFKQEFLEKK
jgi:F-type H+-transporting ATPase subunit alpha